MSHMHAKGWANISKDMLQCYLSLPLGVTHSKDIGMKIGIPQKIL